MIALKCFALVLTLTLLSGCIVYEEHVMLDSDGGVVADVLINAQALAQLAPEAADPFVLKAMLSRTRPPNVDMTIEKSGENMHFVFSSKKVSDLLDWARSEQNPLGVANVQFLDGYLDITRAVKPTNEFHWPKTPGAIMVFKLTAPGTLEATNATRKEGNTAVWELDPGDVLSGDGRKFDARFKVSTPWLTYLLIAATLLGIVAFYIVLRRKNV